MSQKNLNTRMISKHDTQAKWENVSDFIPYKGEIIVYDRDDNYSYERFKIGDGVTTINELSFAAIQPDWSQNDENAADYVKNRTHWVEEGYAEIMPETTIVATDEGRLCITEPFLTPLADGQEYTVSYNGVEYKTTALEVVEDGITVILLGDYGLIMGGTSTGEPFIIVVYPDGLDSIYGEVMDIGGAASVTIKIILDGTITHRLDQKYLPEHIYSAEKVSGVVLPETTVTADATAFLINVAPVNQPILGVNHTVIWNGVSYDCVAVKDDTFSEVIACMLGDSVTTPFSIGVLNSQGIVQTGSYFYVVCNDGKGEKTISININGEKIRTIDMKFLPEELFTKIDSSNLKNGNTEGSLRTIGSNKESDDYALGKHALSTGRHTSAKGEAAHAEGGWTEANGNDSHAEGHSTIANGENSHAEGERAKANGRGSHAEGWDSISTGMSSHAEGYHSESEGIYAHAEGYNSVAKGRAAHTEGQSTIAYGISSHAEGLGTYSDSAYSHVIGSYNLRDKKFDSDYISVKTENIEKTFNRLHSYSIINNNVHPTKFTTVSYSDQNHFGYSVSFGQSIDDQYSTSLSWANLQPGNLFSSDISGENWATYYYEVVEILAITDTEITLKLNKYECISRSYEKAKYVHIVGNGESDKERSNAHTLDWDGNAWYAGDVLVGGTSQEDAKVLATKEYVDEQMASAGSVNSVNGKTGEVVLSASDVNAVPTTRKVNGKALSSDITLSASDVNALPSTTVIPSIEGLATESYVDEKVAGLVESAPETLNTLNELAAALGDDPNFATTVSTQIGNKVDKTTTINDKALSSNITLTAVDVNADPAGTAQAKIDELYIKNGTNSSIRSEWAAIETSNYSLGNMAIALGHNSEASGDHSHAEGALTIASGDNSHAEGFATIASGFCSHAEGSISFFSLTITGEANALTYTYSKGTPRNNYYLMGENGYSKIIDINLEDNTIIVDQTLSSVAIFEKAIYAMSATGASGTESHVEGASTTASGNYSHAEGFYTKASGHSSHAEGEKTIASGESSHAEGRWTTASGNSSHTEGQDTTASGYTSHAEGKFTIAASSYQHVQGRYNIEDTNNKYAHIVGNGESDTARSNAHTLDWDGNAWYAGDIYVGGTNQDEGSEKLLTQSEVNSIINELLAAILPTPTVEDAGKVLRVNEEGKYELVAPLTNEEIDDICGSTVQVSSEMVDEATGESYRLYVSNGELKMEKVV